ncbi:MAG: hypothetical protein QN198_09825 [Armatimonadota bacterium]|nr:hypothetical protein [Armatimonadota bacterium]MDR5703882.1 hypothetical protein [Armatimonadota bacterium]MDR7435800.1 hypothetical protein [Armatimonadota bacterium]
MNPQSLCWEIRFGQPNRVCRRILHQVSRLNVHAHELVIGLCQAYAEVLKAIGEHAHAEDLELGVTLTYLTQIHQAIWQEVVDHLQILTTQWPPTKH